MEFPTLKDLENILVPANPILMQQFEFAHKQQLFYLYQAGTLVSNMAAQLKQQHTQAQLDSFNSYLQTLGKLWLDWLKNENDMELSLDNLPKTNFIGSDIFTATGLKKIKALLNTWSNDKTGIGFIPLVIGAVAGLLALWGIYEISKRFTTTVQDKEDLLTATQKTIKDLGLSPSDAAKFLSDTQAQASAGSGITDILKWGLIAYLGIKIIPMFTNK